MLHGGAGGHLAVVVPADAVGQGEQPAVRARLVLASRGDVAEVVFVVVALLSGVGELRELDLQHGICVAGRGRCYRQAQRCGLVMPVHMYTYSKKDGRDSAVPPGLMMHARLSRGSRYCAAMNRLLTSVVALVLAGPHEVDAAVDGPDQRDSQGAAAAPSWCRSP